MLLNPNHFSNNSTDLLVDLDLVVVCIESCLRCATYEKILKEKNKKYGLLKINTSNSKPIGNILKASGEGGNKIFVPYVLQYKNKKLVKRISNDIDLIP